MKFARAQVLESCDRHHTVQFYDDENYLCGIVADFIAIGVDAGHPALVVATEKRCESIVRRLWELGHDANRLRSDRRLTIINAQDALRTFAKGPAVDRRRLLKYLGAALDRLAGAHPGPILRAYGEIVDMLWDQGYSDAALHVEQLWHELGSAYPLALLCGYSMRHFRRDEHRLEMQEVCAWHSHVLPTEAFMGLTRESQKLRAVASLQQRASALEAELERRNILEQELRLALEEREQAERAREALLAREQAARREAESASRLKDEFLSVLSHEMRTPLNAILGWAQIINTPGCDPQIVRRGLEVVQRNALSHLHLVQDLLDVSRIITGKMMIRSDLVNLAETVKAAIEIVRPSAAAKNLTLTLTIDSEMPAVIGDTDRLRQCTWNLLSNAVKFTPANGSVDVAVEHRGDVAAIVVRDNGQGIAAEFLPYVFDRFAQADPGATRVHGGLGLGLAVVRHLVEAHGGSVSAASDGHGHGATFTISLPTRADLRVPRPSSGRVLTLGGTRG